MVIFLKDQEVKKGKWDRTREIWEKIEDLCEGSLGMYNNLGVYYEKVGELDKSLEYYKLALSMCTSRGHRKEIEKAIGRIHTKKTYFAK